MQEPSSLLMEVMRGTNLGDVNWYLLYPATALWISLIMYDLTFRNLIIHNVFAQLYHYTKIIYVSDCL